MPKFSSLYALLLKLYPASFRERYEQLIERQFRDEYRDAGTRRERIFVWLRALRDLAISIPSELATEFAQDAKYAFRLHRKRPMPAMLAISALALSIGAATGIFSVINAVLLRALPFRNPENLVELRNSGFTALLGRSEFYEWRANNPYLEDAATFSSSEMNFTERNRAVRVKVTEASSNFHRLLGMTPVLGRTFTSDDDRPGSNFLAVISYSIWQQLFGGNHNVQGESVFLNGVPFIVIGVAPPRFDYPGKTDIWIPSAFDIESVPKRGAFVFQTIGRLKSGLDIRQARTLFESEIQRKDPPILKTDEVNRPHMLSIREELSGPVGKASLVLIGMIAFVLLAACANVAHLLLSRIAERRNEIAMRTALGASRGRLIQQLTTEATVLTGAGAVLGLLVAHYTSQFVSTIAPPTLVTQQYTILDWRVVSFAVGLAASTGILFGVFPILLANSRVSDKIIRTQPGMSGVSNSRIRIVLLAGQACITLVLLATSITIGRTFLQMLDTDLGLQPKSAVTMTDALQGTKYRSGPAEWRYYSEVLDRLRAIPGVEAAGAVGYLPLTNSVYMADAFKLDSGQVIERVVTNAATSGYFRAIGTSFLSGRDFRDAVRRSEPEVIVNEAFARVANMGVNLVGRRIKASWSKTPYLIVGIVETSRVAGPAYPGVPMIFWSVEEEPSPNLTFVARVQGNPEPYLARCRDAIKSVDIGVPVYQVASLEDRRNAVLARPRFFTTATLALSVVALLLAVIGTFGTTAQAVIQRSREMGIRMALGGSQTRLRIALLQESIWPTITGAIVGVAIAIACERYLSHLLENVRNNAGWTYAIATILLVSAAFISSWRGSARLLTIHPSDVIRMQ